MTASSKIFCLMSALYVVVGDLASLLVGENMGSLFPVLPPAPWLCHTWYCLWKLSLPLCQLEFHSPWQWLCPDMHMGLLLLCAVLFAHCTGCPGVLRKVGVNGSEWTWEGKEGFQNSPLFRFYFKLKCKWLSDCFSVYMRWSRKPEEVFHPLELELQVFVSQLMWVLGTEIRSFPYWAISPADNDHR